jgi:hypothetical protein
MKSLIRYGQGHRIVVRARRWGRLRHHPAVDGVALGRTATDRRNSIRTDRISPDGGSTAIAIERVIHGIGATGHLADGHRRARPRAGIQADVVGRRVSALHLNRRRLINVSDENALAAEIQRRGTIDRAGSSNRDLRCKSRRCVRRKRSAHELQETDGRDGEFQLEAILTL